MITKTLLLTLASASTLAQTWTRASHSGPSARSGHAMAFDSARGAVVLFGGNISSGATDDTWEFDGV
ncbi:MAG: hypothetical protein ACI9SE_002941, partial [Neolewinella sp.]